MNRIENMNDLTILFSIPFLYLFNTPDPEAKFNYGWALIALNLGNVLFNLSFAFSIQFYGYYKAIKNFSIRKKWIKRPKRKNKNKRVEKYQK